MKINTKYDCKGINWQTISDTLKSVGMAFYEPKIHKKAFEASHTTAFIYDSEKLIGFGRAISDGAYQAAMYDCAVIEEYQGKGIGSALLNKLIDRCRLQHLRVLWLFSAKDKSAFYKKFGFFERPLDAPGMQMLMTAKH